MAQNMRKYARKRAKSVPSARLRSLTTQIEADFVLSLRQVQYGHFVPWLRCTLLKTRRFSENLRLPKEQIDSYHFAMSL